MNCPHCQGRVFRPSANRTKFKLSRSVVVLHKSGELEVNCPCCKRPVILGTLDHPVMRKAGPRLIVRPS